MRDAGELAESLFRLAAESLGRMPDATAQHYDLDITNQYNSTVAYASMALF